jgi:prolyl 4-hydroxylase
MKPHIINNLNNFIMGFYLDDISICDKLIHHHSTSKTQKGIVIGRGGSDTKTDQKKSTDCYLNPTDDIFQEYSKKHLQTVTEQYIKKYPWSNNYFPWTVIENVNIQHYKPGEGFYGWHTERIGSNTPGSSRHLVFMTYLNDVTDGGETEFLHQQVKVSPRKGLTLIWPADWTFTHRGITSLTQHKYIITGWYSYYDNFTEV